MAASDTVHVYKPGDKAQVVACRDGESFHQWTHGRRVYVVRLGEILDIVADSGRGGDPQLVRFQTKTVFNDGNWLAINKRFVEPYTEKV